MNRRRDIVEGVTSFTAAERRLLSGVLNHEYMAEHVFNESGLSESDWTHVDHRAIFQAAKKAHERGAQLDPYSLLEELRAIDPDVPLETLQAIADSDGPSNPKALQAICRHMQAGSARRFVVHEAPTLSKMSMDPAVPVGELADRMMVSAERIQRRLQGMSDEVEGLTLGGTRREFADAPEGDGEWVIPYLLREAEAMLIVGSGGTGKTFIRNMIAICAVNAIHPFSGWALSTTPKRALMVELESAKDDIDDSRDMIVRYVAKILGVPIGDVAVPPVWHWTNGILDLRSAVDRAMFEKVLIKTRPDVVCIGPLKYMIALKPGERDDTAAVALQGVLNRLAAKYGFCWVIEAHGNKEQGYRPAGSVRWEDWPNIGFALQYENPDDMGAESNSFIPYNVAPFRQFRNRRVIFSRSIHRNPPGTSLPVMFGDKVGMIGKKLVENGYMRPEDLTRDIR